MTQLTERTNRLFTKSLPTADLDVARIFFYGLIFALFFHRNFSHYANIPAFFYQPHPLHDFLQLPKPESHWINLLFTSWLVSLFFCSIGFLTRLSAIAAFLMSFYILGWDWSFGFPHHRHHLIVVIMGILAFTRIGQTHSIDSWLRDRFPKALTPKQLTDESWALHLIRFSWCTVFFSAGLAKIRTSGIDLFLTDQMMEYLKATKTWYSSDASGVQTIVRPFVMSKPWLAKLIAGTGILVELLAPVAFFLNGAPRAAVVLGVALLQIGAFLLFYINFKEFAPAYVFWVPWSKVLSLLSMLFQSKSKTNFL